jgi:hypothetical protein
MLRFVYHIILSTTDTLFVFRIYSRCPEARFACDSKEKHQGPTPLILIPTMDKILTLIFRLDTASRYFPMIHLNTVIRLLSLS